MVPIFLKRWSWKQSSFSWGRMCVEVNNIEFSWYICVLKEWTQEEGTEEAQARGVPSSSKHYWNGMKTSLHLLQQHLDHGPKGAMIVKRNVSGLELWFVLAHLHYLEFVRITFLFDICITVISCDTRALCFHLHKSYCAIISSLRTALYACLTLNHAHNLDNSSGIIVL